MLSELMCRNFLIILLSAFVITTRAQEDTLIHGVKFSWYDNYVSMVTDSTINIYMEKSGIEFETGRVIGFYENTRKLYCIGEMVNGEYSGHWISWFYNGQMESEGEFHRKGIRKGVWKWFHDNGNVKAETNFNIHMHLFVFRYTSNPEYYNEYYELGGIKIKYEFKSRDYYSQKIYYDNGLMSYYASAFQDTVEYYCPDGILTESIYNQQHYFNETKSEDSLCYPEEHSPCIDIFSESWPKRIKVKF